MSTTSHHASVLLHMSHPEGISDHHEKVLAEAEAMATKHLETHGFESFKPPTRTSTASTTRMLVTTTTSPPRNRRASLEPGSAIALPPGADVKADLAAPRWKLTPRGIKVEDKKEIVKRLDRSIDKGDAIVLALNEGGRAAAKRAREGRRGGRPDRANVGYNEMKQRGGDEVVSARS
jgi:hypothetical protein